jgi:SAM-dependent methyltransferase
MAARTPRRYRIPDLGRGRRAARLLFESGSHAEAFDLYEQLVDAFPAKALSTLAEAWELYQRLPGKESRYHLYVSRFFDFGIRPGDKVLDIGSGHMPFPFATHLADLAVADDAVGRAGVPFKHADGKPVYECSVESMPFADQEFDFVNCSHVLEHASDPEKACRELMRVGKRGYVETPSREKDLWLHSAGVSHHRWGVSRRGQTLVFTEYAPEDLEGLGCDVLMSMHCAPRTTREKAFSALLYLKASFVNTMLYWEREFGCEVRRLPPGGAAPPAAAPPVAELPAGAGGPLSSAAGSLGRLRSLLRRLR